MKIVANNTQKYLTTLVFVLCSQPGLFVASLQAEQTRSGRYTVELSAHDARLVERALHHLVRAPRPDMPNESDPSFPPGADLNCDEIRRILCIIREQNKKICDKIIDLQEELSIHDMLMEFDHEVICSKIEVVEEELEKHNTVVCSKLEDLEEQLEEHNEIVCSKLEEIQEEIESISLVCDLAPLEELIESSTDVLCSKIEVVEEDLEEHNTIVCSKLEEISREIESLTVICDVATLEELIETLQEVVCSKLEIIESQTDAVGNICDTTHEFGSCVDRLCVDESKGSIIRWLKTILWELRGTFPDGTCTECIPIPPDGL